MTLIFGNDVECAICGDISNQAEVLSTNTNGSPDLDTRPPEMERSNIEYEVQRCPSCGYCTSDLSICNENTKEIVESQRYKVIINDDHLPEIASSFLALSYEFEQNNQLRESIWSAIHASWICDDDQNFDASIKCRKHALSLINKAHSREKLLWDQVGATEAIAIDLMRRVGLFQKALELVSQTKEKELDELVVKVICYEEKLINMKNVESHTISEALGEE
jgi:hypothetical protein